MVFGLVWMMVNMFGCVSKLMIPNWAKGCNALEWKGVTSRYSHSFPLALQWTMIATTSLIHPVDQAEDELEALKRKYQKNMTLVSRQSWVRSLRPLYMNDTLLTHVDGFNMIQSSWCILVTVQELEELQEELQTWKSEAQKNSKIIAEHLEVIQHGQ